MKSTRYRPEYTVTTSKMPTRSQITEERINELLTELGEAGIIHEGEAGQLTATREFNEASEVRKSTPEPQAVTRSKVSSESHREFERARSQDDIQKQIDLIWEVITGREVNNQE